MKILHHFLLLSIGFIQLSTYHGQFYACFFSGVIHLSTIFLALRGCLKQFTNLEKNDLFFLDVAFGISFLIIRIGMKIDFSFFLDEMFHE